MSMQQTRHLIAALGSVLLMILILGIVLSVVAGALVAAAAMYPLTRFKEAVEQLAASDDLKPIPVEGPREVRDLSQTFNNMVTALKESRDRQSQLVSDAGHELKTPLTSMRTNIELLMLFSRHSDNGRFSEQDRKELENDVISQMEEMSSLITDLVDLSREGTARDFDPEEVELEAVVDSSLERVRRRRADVTFDVVTVDWRINGDSFALGRAMLNLLDNAAKWSPEDATVRLRMTPLEPDRLQLTVADSGPGIAPEERERVFDRFYRSAEARSMPGSGLGLSIVQQVIERHGGTIYVTDSDDGGALFVVELPGHVFVPAEANSATEAVQ